MTPKAKTILVSFSGIDGAGKSTQIEHLKTAFESRGFEVRIVAFWDAIATLRGLRESAGHSIFKGDKGVGSPSAPIHRRDKNVRSAPMTAVRVVLYLLDAISNRRVAKRAARSGAGLVIFDRYIYDELANLELTNSVIRLYARALLRIVPRPDISYVLDADPEQARARKPEYPLSFLIENRKSYLMLSDLAGGMTVVPTGPVESVKKVVSQAAVDLLESRLREEHYWSDLAAAVTASESV